MNTRHHDIKAPAPETCAWLNQHESYVTWFEGPRGLLWIKGKPGSGKSTIIKYAIQQQKHQPHSSKQVLASFFFDAKGVPIQKTALGLYRSLLHQILSQDPELLIEHTSIFTERCVNFGQYGPKWEWHVAELKGFLSTYLEQGSTRYPIRIYIDALDEAGVDTAMELINDFVQLISDLPNLYICFSCRNFPNLALDEGLTIRMEDENYSDIENYVHHELQREFSDDHRIDNFTEVIVDEAAGVFQWVIIVIRTVSQLHRNGRSDASILQKLQEIPTDLHELYDQVLASIDPEDRLLAARLMQWIAFAEWPISLQESRYALIIDVDCSYSSTGACRQSPDFVSTDEELKKRIGSLSGGLAEVKREHQLETVQFIHQSVHDYLLENGLRFLDGSLGNDVTGEVNFRLSRACIHYLRMTDVLSHDVGEFDTLYQYDIGYGWAKNERRRRELEEKFPLLRYATLSWISHAKTVELHRIPQQDILTLFAWPSTYLTRAWVRFSRALLTRPHSWPARSMTLLHIAAKNGLRSVVEAIIKSSPGAQVDIPDRRGMTPLLHAASGGHDEIVKLLLSTGQVKVNSKSPHQRTALSWAVAGGHRAVVKSLLATDNVAVDTGDGGGRTPLSHAAEVGDMEAIDRLLATRQVSVDSKDRSGRTPLSWAASKGHTTVVSRLLATRKVYPDSRDFEGRTPLSRAAEGGHGAIINQLFSSHQVAINSRDNKGRTPLSFASGAGHSPIVAQLLAIPSIEVDPKDADNWTPLTWASINGHKDVVTQLLATNQVNITLRDKWGRTPRSLADGEGFQAIVALLDSYHPF
jgi:ankyrin repeat protein